MTPTRIVVHCAATPEGGHYNAADIDRWHRARGWNGIGYHAVVLLDGTLEPGRPETQPGAHVVGHNHDSLAVCYIGGVATDAKTPKDTRTDAQRLALLDVVSRWCQRYGIPPLRVFGHRELDPRKACPSFEMDPFRGELAALLAGDSPDIDPPDEFDALRGVLATAFRALPMMDLRQSDAEHAARMMQSLIGVEPDAILGGKTYHALAYYIADQVLWQPVHDHTDPRQ